METTTSFDLNRSMQSWRENLGQSPAFQRENLDELESHLRDSIVSLQSRELSTEEAFVIATRRIGKNRLLDAEFGKINGPAVWLDRMLWMLIGIQIWGLVSNFFYSISRSAVSLGLGVSHFDLSTPRQALPMVLFTLVQLLAFAGSLVFCWWLIVRKGQVFSSRIEPFLHRRATLAATCGALCMISLFISGLGYGSEILLWKLTDMRAVSFSMNYSALFGRGIPVVALIVLTLILARKRLRLSEA